jgi:UTP--glucose-1-phosphate uridylyltransferase
MKITKAVITAAGRGTRFLPVSKAFQKEMVPVMHKPQLQWVIEEAVESGITDIAVVVREGVNTLPNYLSENRKLWKFLKESGKENLMEEWLYLKSKAHISIYRQKESDPYGNGTPFIKVQRFVGKDPFVAMWGDDIMIHVDNSKPTCVRQIIELYEKYEPTAIMSTKELPEEEIVRTASYEYYAKEESQIPYQARRLIEKPKPEEILSKRANACRFILTYKVIEELRKKITGKDNEIWLTDAINRLMARGELVMAPPWKGSIWVPVGDPIRWLKANLVVALIRDRYRKDARRMLREVERLGS